jgi:hypothetical protein
VDDKVIQLPTGYEPADPPPTADDIKDVKAQLAIVLDELEILSKRVTQLTKIIKATHRKD